MLSLAGALRMPVGMGKLVGCCFGSVLPGGNRIGTLDIKRSLIIVPYQQPQSTGFHGNKNKRLGAYAAIVRKQRLRQANVYKTPTLADALSMPLSVQEMDNSTLVTLGAMEHHEARKEILRRHIMVKDNISYEQACHVFETQIAVKNKDAQFLLALPYQLGMGIAMTAGILSVPMVFSLPMAKWFNSLHVTTDVPEPRDLETMLEVGSWTWNWMEPPLGTISFVLLTMQFTRAQLENLGLKPYTQAIKHWRGKRLAEAFPQYDSNLLIAYSETSSIAAHR